MIGNDADRRNHEVSVKFATVRQTHRTLTNLGSNRPEFKVDALTHEVRLEWFDHLLIERRENRWPGLHQGHAQSLTREILSKLNADESGAEDDGCGRTESLRGNLDSCGIGHITKGVCSSDTGNVNRTRSRAGRENQFVIRVVSRVAGCDVQHGD